VQNEADAAPAGAAPAEPQVALPDVPSYFRTQLKERNIARFNVNKYTDVNFELLEEVKIC
jgi:hypothetical protein